MTDTICAPATAPGGALGIIRVSGSNAFTAVSSLCSVSFANCAANTVHFTRLYTPSKGLGEVLDEALVTIFHAPHSYTGEDSVEISCHGSSYILNKVLEILVQQGCRIARPGEFTQRAYLNGKMDLSQAEAVADLIASSNKATHDIAMSQLRGHFSSELARLRDQLLKLTSLLELELDFSDHEDLEFADRSQLYELAKTIDNRITQLARSFETGQAIKQGIPVAIVGKTNVGKSTLLNRLLKDERAIVSNIHGTTRDTIEDTIDIHGVTFRFIDTAGIRQTSDQVEQIGIERTYQAISKARIVLWMIDAEPSTEEISDIIQRIEKKSLIVVVNKIDKHHLPALSALTSHTPYPVVKIAAKYAQGIPQLEQAIYDAAQLPDIIHSDIIITNARHYDALIRAHESIERVIVGMNQQLPGDLLAEDLRLTIDTLAEITGGQITPHEVLGNIFTNFCVGK